jgi:hypothetical protein
MARWLLPEGRLGRLRVALHPFEECQALLGRSARDPERGTLPIWAAAIDEAARRGVASGWQTEPGLLIGVLPGEAADLAAAFIQRALPLIAPCGEPHLAYRMGRLARWPRLWSEAAAPAAWGRSALARAETLCGLSVVSLAWADACLADVAERLGARPLGDHWNFPADERPVTVGGRATVFCPVGEWLEAMCAQGASKEILAVGLRASLSSLVPAGRNEPLGA